MKGKMLYAMLAVLLRDPAIIKKLNDRLDLPGINEEAERVFFTTIVTNLAAIFEELSK